MYLICNYPKFILELGGPFNNKKKINRAWCSMWKERNGRCLKAKKALFKRSRISFLFFFGFFGLSRIVIVSHGIYRSDRFPLRREGTYL